METLPIRDNEVSYEMLEIAVSNDWHKEDVENFLKIYRDQEDNETEFKDTLEDLLMVAVDCNNSNKSLELIKLLIEHLKYIPFSALLNAGMNINNFTLRYLLNSEYCRKEAILRALDEMKQLKALAERFVDDFHREVKLKCLNEMTLCMEKALERQND